MEFLTLQQIVEGFNAPINEEQAWAVCYQCGKILQDQREISSSCRKLSGLESVKVFKDGSVEAVDSEEGCVDSMTSSESELVQSLGLVVYQALDYGLGENEEHTLTPALEALISHMTGSDTDTEPEGDVDGDEGIEHDEPPSHIAIDTVIQLCIDHAGSGQEAAPHYKAVCRALHAEAQELISFLQKISEKKRLQIVEADEEERKRLEELQRADWARLWLQVMRHLRHGIKLKKVEHTEITPAEYELTPYEMLMEDIRSHRYSLNKIMVNGDIPPQTKKDAHSVILDFIRSRPPLHPAKDRVLASAPLRTPDVREKLLREIKSEPRLKPVPGNIAAENRLDDLKSSPRPGRKVIKPDVSLFIDNSSDEELTDDEDEVFDDKNKLEACPLSPLSPLSPPPLNAASKSPWTQSVDLDLESQEACFRPGRRHSITVCESPEKPQASKTTMQVNGKSPSSNSTRSTISENFSPRPLKPSLECLSLTIEEVMHIRNVLTKAELESLLVDPELHELVAKGKVCFRCKENRFTLFGHWSTKCKFCSRNVCSKCFSKMRIPTEHFEHIPVYTLSPSPLTPGSNKFDFLFPFELSGSAPTSPADEDSDHLALPPRPPPPRRQPSIPDNVNNNRNRPPLQRAKTTTKPPPPRAIEGPLMNVCKDCKAMVVNIIKASRFSLAGAGPSKGRFIECPQRKALRNFHLDLKPVYK